MRVTMVFNCKMLSGSHSGPMINFLNAKGKKKGMNYYTWVFTE